MVSITSLPNRIEIILDNKKDNIFKDYFVSSLHKHELMEDCSLNKYTILAESDILNSCLDFIRDNLS